MDTTIEKTILAINPTETDGNEVNYLQDFRDLQAGKVTPEDLAERYKAKDRKLIDSALLDSLTGLLNRRGLSYEFIRKLPAIKREIKDNKRVGLKSCYVMLDLDDMKSVNDIFGHIAGDSLLSYIGQTLNTLLRSSDQAARVGGDEMVVVLDNVSAGEALRVTERWRTVLTNNEEAFLPQGVHAAMSIGIVEFPNNVTLEDFDDPGFGNRLLHQAYQQADTMLYEAKRSGKGKTVIFPVQQTPEPAILVYK